MNKHMAFTPKFSKGMSYETAHKELMKDRESWDNVFKPSVAVNIWYYYVMSPTDWDFQEPETTDRTEEKPTCRKWQSPTPSPSSWRKSQTSEDVEDTPAMNQRDLAAVTGHSTQPRGHILYKWQARFTKTDPMLSHKAIRKISGKISNIWRLNSIILNNSSKEKWQKK